ncbi:hypothetical protein R7070_05440 [Vibrio sp. 1557]|uniref:hypothetical protein n=1 Tax=Vibrio TaxID=662 RepID=UPI00211A07E2|nr:MULTISPECIES: hypothetical protein [Vibrio]MCQ9068112.1 hypothetical protein [Vibrio alginolyticus]MDW2262191.1 hypothetical protein [Vibrio sp. 1557]
MEDISLASDLVIYLTTVGILGIFAWFLFVIYLKSKWLKYLEDALDNGVRYYTLNIFLSGHGVLQYGTVFLSTFRAKRYKMLEKRDKVPIHIQRLFVLSFVLFISSTSCLLAGVITHHIYIE